MNEKQFEAVEQEGGLDVFGYVSGNYAKTKKNFQQMAATTDFKVNESDRMSYYSNRVPDARSRDFKDCMRERHLYFELDGSADTTIILSMHWDAPPEILRPLKLVLPLKPENAVLETQPPPTLGNGSEFSLKFKRGVPGKAMVVDVNAVGSTEQTSRTFKAHFIDQPCLPNQSRRSGIGSSRVTNV